MSTTQTERLDAARYDLRNLRGPSRHPDPDPDAPIDLLDPDRLVRHILAHECDFFKV